MEVEYYKNMTKVACVDGYLSAILEIIGGYDVVVTAC